MNIAWYLVKTYQADSFKRKHGGPKSKESYYTSEYQLTNSKCLPNKQSEIFWVKELDIRYSSLGNNLKLASKNVYQSHQDKTVSNKRSCAQFG